MAIVKLVAVHVGGNIWSSGADSVPVALGHDKSLQPASDLLITSSDHLTLSTILSSVEHHKRVNNIRLHYQRSFSCQPFSLTKASVTGSFLNTTPNDFHFITYPIQHAKCRSGKVPAKHQLLYQLLTCYPDRWINMSTNVRLIVNTWVTAILSSRCMSVLYNIYDERARDHSPQWFEGRVINEFFSEHSLVAICMDYILTIYIVCVQTFNRSTTTFPTILYKPCTHVLDTNNLAITLHLPLQCS